ncbi:S26 family signal peptidase [Sphingomonas sp. UYP23]
MTERPELPLFAAASEAAQATETRRTERLRRSRVIRRGATAVTGIALLALLALTIARPPLPRLVWNASASAPVGLYIVSPSATIARGDMVVAWAPPGPRRLAAQRHYLPINVPLVKRVAGIAGDRVCARGATIWIADRVVVVRKPRDGTGRAMPWWSGCATLRYGAVLLLNAPPDSFDGRYFGPIERGLVIGRAIPVWVH